MTEFAITRKTSGMRAGRGTSPPTASAMSTAQSAMRSSSLLTLTMVSTERIDFSSVMPMASRGIEARSISTSTRSTSSSAAITAFALARSPSK